MPFLVIPQGGMKNIFSTVNPATTFWTLVYNFRVNCFVLAGLTAEKGIQPEKQRLFK